MTIKGLVKIKNTSSAIERVSAGILNPDNTFTTRRNKKSGIWSMDDVYEQQKNKTWTILEKKSKIKNQIISTSPIYNSVTAEKCAATVKLTENVFCYVYASSDTVINYEVFSMGIGFSLIDEGGIITSNSLGSIVSLSESAARVSEISASFDSVSNRILACITYGYGTGGGISGGSQVMSTKSAAKIAIGKYNDSNKTISWTAVNNLYDITISSTPYNTDPVPTNTTINTPINSPINTPITTPGTTPGTTPINTPISTPGTTPINTPINTPITTPAANTPAGTTLQTLRNTTINTNKNTSITTSPSRNNNRSTTRQTAATTTIGSTIQTPITTTYSTPKGTLRATLLPTSLATINSTLQATIRATIQATLQPTLQATLQPTLQATTIVTALPGDTVVVDAPPSQIFSVNELEYISENKFIISTHGRVRVIDLTSDSTYTAGTQITSSIIPGNGSTEILKTAFDLNSSEYVELAWDIANSAGKISRYVISGNTVTAQDTTTLTSTQMSNSIGNVVNIGERKYIWNDYEEMYQVTHNGTSFSVSASPLNLGTIGTNNTNTSLVKDNNIEATMMGYYSEETTSSYNKIVNYLYDNTVTGGTESNSFSILGAEFSNNVAINYIDLLPFEDNVFLLVYEHNSIVYANVLQMKSY
jgi:hypothetical protein